MKMKNVQNLLSTHVNPYVNHKIENRTKVEEIFTFKTRTKHSIKLSFP
jgi:hypothetical protein